MNKSITIKKITVSAILTSLALIAFTLENLFPPIIIPGAKLGLSNIFILLTFFSAGSLFSFLGLTVKVILGSLFTGNFSTLIYSLPSGIIALAIEILLFEKTNGVSIPAISTVGSLVNVFIQNLVFCLVTSTLEYISFLPYLALISTFSGLTVGLVVHFLIKKIPSKMFFTFKEENLEHI